MRKQCVLAVMEAEKSDLAMRLVAKSAAAKSGELRRRQAKGKRRTGLR